MAYALSEAQVTYLKYLEANFPDHVGRYAEEKQKQLDRGKRAELEEELKGLERYLAGCQAHEIDEVEINERFCYAKIQELKRILGVKES